MCEQRNESFSSKIRISDYCQAFEIHTAQEITERRAIKWRLLQYLFNAVWFRCKWERVQLNFKVNYSTFLVDFFLGNQISSILIPQTVGKTLSLNGRCKTSYFKASNAMTSYIATILEIIVSCFGELPFWRKNQAKRIIFE